VLDRLTGDLATGIEARVLAPAGRSGLPALLWSVQGVPSALSPAVGDSSHDGDGNGQPSWRHGPGRLPSPLAREAGWRTWWGRPLRCLDGTELFVEWPFELPDPGLEECLTRVNWGGPGLLLISHQPPLRLLVPVPATGRAKGRLIDVSRVVIAKP